VLFRSGRPWAFMPRCYTSARSSEGGRTPDGRGRGILITRQLDLVGTSELRLERRSTLPSPYLPLQSVRIQPHGTACSIAAVETPKHALGRGLILYWAVSVSLEFRAETSIACRAPRKGSLVKRSAT